MEEIDKIIADYDQKVIELGEQLDNCICEVVADRLTTKMFCYKEFIIKLQTLKKLL